MTDDDTALLEDLRAMWLAIDPPPPGLVETMVAVVASAGLDHEWELLALVRDSADEPAAQVRGLGTARVLYFRAVQGWTLDAEIDSERVSGEILDFTRDLASVRVTLETRAGDAWDATPDESGFFSMRAPAAGSLRFTVDDGESVASSRWVEL